MTDQALRLKDELLSLPEDDRISLARLLWKSIDDETDDNAQAEWDVELDRRFAEIESGKAEGEPARQVIEELRKKFT